MHKVLDVLGFPRLSQAGKQMTILERITNQWLWTDDPDIVRLHEQQDLREGKLSRIK
jgi:hypothetical protein